MVTAAQKAAIKDSWAGVDLQVAGNAFYNQLQANAPDAYAVFNLGSDSGKIAAQGLKVMTFIDGIVKGLDDMDGVKASIDTLGGRHTSYGAKKVHFGPAGPCLLAALAEVCGGKFTPAAKDGWTALYGLISDGICAHLS
uniref:Hemoglobin n=1 Tax=Branchipolynoe segonzaci TaxID=907760 RepID=E7BQB5_9ANNE|nr:hemoglobin [Branchinotogluma segonzaci]